MGNPERTSSNPSERALSPSNISELQLRWRFNTNGSMFSSPIFVNGTVFFGAWDGYEYALHASNGTLVWKTYLGYDSNCYVGGIDSTPAYWNGSLFLGGSGDYWYALNAANGTVEWKVYVGDVSKGNYNWASALVFNDSLYIGIASCEDAPLVWGRLLQVNLSGNHTVNHTFDVVPSNQVGGSIWATPAVDPTTNTVWVATGNDNAVDQQPLSQSIVALNASNLSLIGSWQVPNVAGLDDDFGSTPTLVDDSAGGHWIVDTNKNGVLYSLNRSNVTTGGTWKPTWQRTTGGIYSPAAFDGGRIYAAGGQVSIGGTYYAQSVTAFDPSNGSVVWQRGTNNGTIYGAVSWANGLVLDPAGSILEIRDASTGQMLKSFQVASGQSIAGPAIVAGGQIIVGSGDYSSHGALYDLGTPLNASFYAGPTNQDAPSLVGLLATPEGGSPPYNATWYFGDGSIGYGMRSQHVYQAQGDYNVTLNLSDSAGDWLPLWTIMSVRQGLAVTSSVWPRSLGVAPLAVHFLSNVLGGDGRYTYNWSFGDGGGSSLPTPVHTYTDTGSYPVILVVNDSSGGKVWSNLSVSVNQPVVVGISADMVLGDAPLTVNFVSNISLGVAPYLPAWNFGDGSTSVFARNSTHEFSSPASYTVTLNVVDLAGESRSASLEVDVLTPPSAQIDLTFLGIDCPSGLRNYQFHGSAFGGMPPYTYSWVLPDGRDYGVQDTNRSFLATTNVSADLTVIDSFNRTAETNLTFSPTDSSCPKLLPAKARPSATSTTDWTGWIPDIAAIVGLAAAVGFLVEIVRRRRRVSGP